MTRKYLIQYIVLLLSMTAIQTPSAQVTQSYRAHYEEPCGRSLLVLQRPGEKPIAVQATGTNPGRELIHSVLVNIKLNVHGYFTGRHIDDQHCGIYPEFYVTQYSAIAPVTRCSSVSDWLIYETLVLYPTGLPNDKLIELDFEKNRSLLNEVSLSQCRSIDKNAVCNTGEASANVCGQPMNWCCTL